MNSCELNPIQNHAKFEEFCCEVARDVFGDFSAQRYGRNGQNQGGIDIQAVNRRHGRAQKVVIQCKYYDRSKFNLQTVVNDLKKDFFSALEAESNQRFSFEVFVFAASLELDTKIQDIAASLSAQHGKEVLIWFWDNLKDAVSAHPRLQRLFARGVNSSGVRFLSKNFIDSLRDRELDPFRFFAAKHVDDCQWLGVAKGLAAQRDCQEPIESDLKAQFVSRQIDRKVVAVVCGEGGSGKSTLLRQIALNQANEKSVWWIENIATFLQYDAVSISENSHLSCLLIIEDWYRNMKGLSCSDFFYWLSAQSHVLVLIGDRTYQHTVYGDYCRSGAKYELFPDENKNILDFIQSTCSEYRQIFSQYRSNLFHQNSLFILLFIAAIVLTEGCQLSSSVDLSDGPLISFQKIIANQLLSLELDKNYQGMGKALILLGMIYSSSKLQYHPLSESFFLHASSFLGSNSKIFDLVETAGYPREVNALIFRNTVVSRQMGGALERLEFNHDVLADKGVIYAHEYSKDLQISDSYTLLSLLKALTNSEVEPDGILVFWIWLFQHDVFLNFKQARECLLQILQKAPSRIGPLTFRSLLSTLSEEISTRHEVCDFLLSQPNFAITIHVSVVIAALAEVSQYLKIQKANSICDLPGFHNYCHEEIVLFALNNSAPVKANQVLAQIFTSPVEYLRLPSRILKSAFKLLPNSQKMRVADQICSILTPDIPVDFCVIALEKASKISIDAVCSRILASLKSSTDFPAQIITAAINSADRPSAQSIAIQILQDPLFYIHHPDHLIHAALRFSPPSVSSSASCTILSLNNFYKSLPETIVLEALKHADVKVSSIAAEQILSNTEEYRTVSSELLVMALRLAQDSARAADIVLLLPDFYKTLPHNFIIEAMTLASAQISRKASDAILANHDDYLEVSSQLTLKALGMATCPQKAAECILSASKLYRKSPDLVIEALKVAESEAAETAAELIILDMMEGNKLSEHLVAFALELVPDPKRKSEEILGLPEYFNAVPSAVILKAFKLSEASVAQDAASRLLCNPLNILSLSQQLVSAALKHAEHSLALQVSSNILSQSISSFPNLIFPDSTFILLMTYADKTLSSRVSHLILSDPAVLTSYTEELIARSLFDASPGDAVFLVARTIINSSEGTFDGSTIFFALQSLMASSLKEDGLRVISYVDSINQAVSQKLPGYKIHKKLYNLLIRLPIFDSQTHVSRFSYQMRRYNPWRPVAEKTILANIMKSIIDKPAFTKLDDVFHWVCMKILSCSLDDLGDQLRHDEAIEWRHLIIALNHPALTRKAHDKLISLLEFVSSSGSSLQGSEFHSQLMDTSTKLEASIKGQSSESHGWGLLNLQRLESFRDSLGP
jgi:hypothetical protein